MEPVWIMPSLLILQIHIPAEFSTSGQKNEANPCMCYLVQIHSSPLIQASIESRSQSEDGTRNLTGNPGLENKFFRCLAIILKCA